jgi:hypothetical protein
MQTARYYRNGVGFAVPMGIVRSVWAEVTANPHVSYDVIAARIGTTKTIVARAFHALRDAGYIDFPYRSKKARTIIVPFVVAQKAKQ